LLYSKQSNLLQVAGEFVPDLTVGRVFGERLRSRRAALGLTQAAAAKSAGISRDYYGALESGMADRRRGDPANPTLTTLRGLASVLRCSIGELVDGLPSVADPSSCKK
jgi:transcriptional regulator with XRE-family HTH domain